MQCPMCRAVFGDAAAQCPVCGMALRSSSGVYQPPQPERRHYYERSLYPPIEGPRVQPPVQRSASYGILTVAVALLIIAAGVFTGWVLHGKTRRAAAVYTLGSQERILKVGDEWTYRINATVSMGSMEMAKVKGVAERRIEKSKLYAGALQDRFVFRFEGKGIPGMPVFHLTATFVQDPKTGERRLLGVHDGKGRYRRIAQPGIVETGLWFLERNNTYRIMYEDGTAEVLAEKVVGTELVSTPAGKFHAWKVEMGYEGVSTMLAASGSGTASYVPQLGSPAHEHITLDTPLGISAEGTLRLESTNVKVENTLAESLKSQSQSLPNLLLKSESKDRVR